MELCRARLQTPSKRSSFSSSGENPRFCIAPCNAEVCKASSFPLFVKNPRSRSPHPRCCAKNPRPRCVAKNPHPPLLCKGSLSPLCSEEPRSCEGRATAHPCHIKQCLTSTCLSCRAFAHHLCSGACAVIVGEGVRPIDSTARTATASSSGISKDWT